MRKLILFSVLVFGLSDCYAQCDSIYKPTQIDAFKLPEIIYIKRAFTSDDMKMLSSRKQSVGHLGQFVLDNFSIDDVMEELKILKESGFVGKTKYIIAETLQEAMDINNRCIPIPYYEIKKE